MDRTDNSTEIFSKCKDEILKGLKYLDIEEALEECYREGNGDGYYGKDNKYFEVNRILDRLKNP